MMEIERKWLVDKSKCPIFIYGEESFNLTKWKVVQGYLNSVKDEWLIRVRRVDTIEKNKSVLNDYFLEMKSHGLLSREELRIRMNKTEFEEILKKCEKTVEKQRYLWNALGVQFEIDVYDRYDFITCEVEFNSEEEANNFVAPNWCTKDITMDSGYKNVNLAK